MAGQPDRRGAGHLLRIGRLPDRLAGGRAGALLDPRRPPLPQPGFAALLRHRRLVADVRPHVPALRHAVRVGLDRQEHQRLRLHRRRARRPDVRAEATEYEARYVPARARAIPGTPARSAPTWAGCSPPTPRTSSTGGATGCAPSSSATSSGSTPSTPGRLAARPGDPARGRDRRARPRLEDPLDAQLRPVLLHDRAQRDDRAGARRSRPGAHGPPAVVGRGSQLGLDRGPLEDEGGDRRRRRAARDLRVGRDGRATSCGALDASERGRRFVSEQLRPHQQAFGYKAIWSHEFAFKTWVENPAPIIEAIRGYLATDYDYPANIKAVADDLERAKAEVMEGVEGEAREQLQRALDLSLNMNPLTPDHHFYIDQGANARVRLVAIAIGRKLVEAGALDDPEDVIFLHYNELRLIMADQQAFDARELVSDRRDEHEDAFERRPPSWVGHRDRGGARVPVQRALGLPGQVLRGRAGDDGRGQGPGRVPGRDRGARAVRVLARRVRPGRAGRHPRVPDDEPGVGGPVHEDLRPGDRGRRRGLAPGRRRARVRHPGGRRARATPASASRPATASG